MPKTKSYESDGEDEAKGSKLDISINMLKPIRSLHGKASKEMKLKTQSVF